VFINDSSNIFVACLDSTGTRIIKSNCLTVLLYRTWLVVTAELYFKVLVLSGYLFPPRFSCVFIGSIIIWMLIANIPFSVRGYLGHAFCYPPQLNNLAVEQDIYNLRRDCEEKDTTIKELTTLLNCSEVANYKVILVCNLSLEIIVCNFFFWF